jgi:hypothetical protein
MSVARPFKAGKAIARGFPVASATAECGFDVKIANTYASPLRRCFQHKGQSTLLSTMCIVSEAMSALANGTGASSDSATGPWSSAGEALGVRRSPALPLPSFAASSPLFSRKERAGH